MASTASTVHKPIWQEVAKAAQEYRDASIVRVEPAVPEVPKELALDVTKLPQELLSEQEVEITHSLAEDLITSISSGKLSCTAVIKAFLRRAGLAQRLVSLLQGILCKRT